MFELLQQTSRLHKPRMTPVLEGKARMQGPLDQPDATTDFKSSEVCANCRNDLDATQMQNCMICSGGYHSVCLEILRNADDDDIRCCYKCQLSGVHDKTQSSSTGVVTNEVAHDEQPSAERMDGPRASDEVYVSKGLHTTESQAVNSNTNTKELETAAGKIISDSTEEVSKIVYNPSLTHPVKKQGVWRKEIADSLQFSGFVDQVELMSSDTCKKAMKGIVVDAKQIFAVLPERTGAGDIPDKQMVVEVFTKPARDNDVKNMPELFVSKKASDVKHLDCAITAEVQEEKESDKKLEASISEQGKSVENELEQGPITADKTFKDDQLSHTSSVLMGQSVITVPTFSANCFVESKKVKEIHGNVMREGCVLEELDCNKTCNKTQSFLLSSQLSGVKLSNEEQPTDQSFIAVDNDTAVALAPYEWTSSRKQDSHTDITQVETHVPKDTSHTTRSDHVGNVTKMDKHVDVLKECSTGLFKVPNVDEETSFLQDQGTLESEVSCATEANPFSGQDMENNAQNVVHYVDSQTGTVQGALLQTAVHPTAEKLAALESKLSCICVVSDRLENMAVEPCDCIHPVPASCPTISVDHFPASAATIKLLHGQCKQLLIATDEETILPKTWDSTFQNPTQGDLAGGQPPNGNVSEDKMEEVLAIVNLDQSALSTAESSLMILEAVCAPLGTPSVIGSLEGDLVLPQDATSIRVSLDDGISPQEDASSIRAPSSSDVSLSLRIPLKFSMIMGL